MSFTVNPEEQALVQGTISAVSQTIDITSPNSSTSIVQVLGTWSGTLVIEGSNNDIDYNQIHSVNSTDYLFKDSIVSNGCYITPTNGFKSIRIRSESWTSGTVSVFVYGSDSSSVVRTDTSIRGNTDGTQIGNSADRLKTEITFEDGHLVDSVGKLRTIESVVLFSESFPDSDHAFSWAQLVASGGTVTYEPLKARKGLNVNTVSGSSAKVRSKRYIQYLPGRSFIATYVANFAAPKTNVVQEAGIFDEDDGLFFSVNGTTQNVVVRSSSSGTPIDTIIPRANWNLDKFDGSGPSGLDLDLTKSFVYVIDYSWYGFGRIRFGILAAGQYNYCHELISINLPEPFSRRGSFPISYSIRNIGATASPTVLYQGSCSVAGEGKVSIATEEVSLNNGATEISVSSNAFSYPLAVRLQSAFKKNELIPLGIEAYTSSNSSIFYEVVLRPDSVIGGTWVAAPNSITEFNRGITSITGGKVIESGYLSNSNKADLNAIADRLRLSFDTLNNIPDMIVVRVTAFSGNASVACAITLGEIY